MEKPKKRRWWILIVIIILLLSCVLVALYLLSRLQVASSPLPPTPAQLTTEMKIVISAAAIKSQNGTDAFVVLANTNLTVQSNDTTDHTCLISGGDIQPISVQLKGGKASSPFKLPVGVYQLTCDKNPKRVLVITAQ